MKYSNIFKKHICLIQFPTVAKVYFHHAVLWTVESKYNFVLYLQDDRIINKL